MIRIFTQCILPICALLFSLTNSLAQGSINQGDEGYRLIGHRGGVVDSAAAENSLAALKKAVDAG